MPFSYSQHSITLPLEAKFQESRFNLRFAALPCKIADYRKREKEIEPSFQMRLTNWARVGFQPTPRQTASFASHLTTEPCASRIGVRADLAVWSRQRAFFGYTLTTLEARVGIEPTNAAFAEPC